VNGSRPRTQTTAGWLRGRATANAVGLLVLVLLGVAYLLLSLQLPAGTVREAGDGTFPRMIGILLVVCALLALLGTRKASAAPATWDEDEPPEHQFGEAAWRVPAVAGSVLFYVVVAPLLGHLATATVLSFFVLALLGDRPRWQVAVVSVALGASTYALFTVLLDVALPAGRWLP